MSRRTRLPPWLALVVPLAAACAADTATTEAFDRRMGSYVGRSEAELVAGLGVPNRTYDAADGRRLLQYELYRPSSAPAVYPSIGFGFGSGGGGGGFSFGGVGLGFGLPAQSPVAPCTVVFELRGGYVAGLDRHGEGCVAAPA
jgi:hypothetical protein